MVVFAAIDVGSYELSMKVYEYVGKSMKEIDHVRHKVELGLDTYMYGKISNEHINEVCKILYEFKVIMKSYKVTEYRACATSAFRDIDNANIVLDQIEQRTGIRVGKLSNSEQCFLSYKSLATKLETFGPMIEKSTAIVDFSGGSIQISLFDKEALVVTQKIKLGIYRLQEMLRYLNATDTTLETYMMELVNPQLSTFKKMYLKDKTVSNIIILDDYLSDYLSQNGDVKHQATKGNNQIWSAQQYEKLMRMIIGKNKMEVSKVLNMSEDASKYFLVCGILLDRIVAVLQGEYIWAPATKLVDGMAYEYGEEHKLLHVTHNFEQDIIASAQNISKRFMGSKKRSETLEDIALNIFDATKKIHGLGKRERLLLKIATILHDCGKYISMTALGETSYSIIMATEIIGLSHLEREIIALVVRYNHDDFEYFDERERKALNVDAYLVMSKLTAILRIANALDRSHKQKFKSIKCIMKDEKLVITVDTNEDITVEKSLMKNRAIFFEEVFNVLVDVRRKRSI
ncbi:MAG: HD domain-containing protein [Lachnospiraceae bacterium]